MTPPTKALHRTEFVALMAMLIATVAFSTDAMLPAFPEIADELTPGNANRVQLIVTSFVLGLGTGTLFVGPLSDAFGRKSVIVYAAALYIFGALLAWIAPTLELLLLARVIQGLGAAGPRIVTLAIVRDLYSGTEMARILSFVFMIFSVVPALAPTIGHYVIEAFGWRSIFLCFVFFVLLSCTWLTLRQPETLAETARRPLNLTSIWGATREVLGARTTRISIYIQMLTTGMLFSTIQSIQPVFDITFAHGESFHIWFGGMALLATTSAMLNAFLVVRVGMRAIIRTSYLSYAGITIALVVLYPLISAEVWRFALFLVFAQTTFFVAGLTIGNLNALALEPLGHIAGTASSVIAAISTVGGILIALPIGLAFNGTPMPWAVGALICAVVAYLLTRTIKRPGEV